MRSQFIISITAKVKMVKFGVIDIFPWMASAIPDARPTKSI
jgi:hypothetical protein